MKKGKLRVLAGMMWVILAWMEILSVGIKVSAAGGTSVVIDAVEIQDEGGTVDNAVAETEIEESENGTENEETWEEVSDGDEFVRGESESDSEDETGEEDSIAEKIGDLETEQEIETTDKELLENERGTESATRRLENMTSVNDIASGISNDIAWVIDANGKLTVEGTGDFGKSKDYDRAPWFGYNIISAEINVLGMTDASFMFYACLSLNSVDMSGFDTRSITDMNYMFYECRSLSSIDVSNFDTRNVTDMSHMFCECSSLSSLDVSNFDTKNVTDMSFMFCECSGLSSLDVSGFDTESVTSMNQMFCGCSNLSSIDVSGFDTENVEDMWGMFNSCSSLEYMNISRFNTKNVRDMRVMFSNCRSLKNVDMCSIVATGDMWDFNRVIMSSMFNGCSSLRVIDLSRVDAGCVSEMEGMFTDCNNLVTIYTPYNLKCSVPLPSAIWYRSDGTTVTELPQYLNYSVALGLNYIPKEKDYDDQLNNSGNSIFLFCDAVTGVPIKNGRVCIEEELTSTRYYCPSKNTGYILFPHSENCKRVFISTYFDGYERFDGWVDLNCYQSESGIYTFDINPMLDKYIPKLPSMKTTVATLAPDVKTEEGNISLLNMEMDFELDLGKGVKSTVAYDVEKKTIKVAVSTEKEATFDEIKEAFKAGENKSADARLKNAKNQMKSDEICSVNVNVTVEGYLEFTEYGEFIEGGAIVNVQGLGTVEYRPVCTVGLAYAKYELGVSAEGKLIFTYVGGNLDTALTLKLEPYAKYAVGAGWSLAHTEIGAVGKLPITIDFPWEDAKNSLNIDAVLELYGEVKFFYFGEKYTAEIKENIWPAISVSNYDILNDKSSLPASNELEILPRNYLSSENQNRNSVYSAQNQSCLTPSDSFRYSEISKDYGVFEENNVQYAKLSNGTEILAWIHDFGNKSSANRTTLVYSVNKNDGNGWSNITPVCDDTATGDYYPNMTAEGNKAYLVWNKASKEFDDNTGIDVVSSYMDVYVSVFENGVFSKPQMVSDADNGLIEFSPIVAVNGNSAAVAWMTNSENDYHYTKGSNAIYVCEYSSGSWQSPVCYAQDLHYVSDYDMDYVNGSVAVLYAEDADNVSATQDGTVYYVKNGVKNMIGDASYHAEIVDLCDGKLYFSGGSKVYKASADKLSYIYDTGIATDNFSVVKNASGGEVILFLQQDGFANNVCAAYLREGVYTAPVPIISDNSRITNYSPIYNEDGTISIAYDEEEVLEASDAIYGLTDMVVKRKVEPALFFVDADLAYNAYDVAPGNTIEFAALVSNYTTHAVSKVKATLSGNSFGEIYEGVLEVDIPMGEQQYVSLSYTLPDTIVNQQYTLTVTPVDFEDSDLSDNSAICELGFSDIAVSDLKLENNKITGTVKNVGCQTAENVSLTIKEDNQENSPIAVLSYDGINLAAGESWEFSQEVEAFTFQNVGEVKYYLVSAQTDSRENNYRNDSATVYSEPIASTGILLDQTTMIMTEKTSGSIHAEVLPENATFQNAVYTSSDNRVVVVDPMGNVYAVGKGEAVITAYSLDGEQSAECEVTVEGSEVVKYTLSKRKLELEIGGEASLYVSDENGDNVEGVSWSSTDENIVTIAQDGSVMATGEGIAYLVAKADSFVDVCIVRVSDHSILQLACEESFLQLTVGETAQLEIEIIPKDTTMEKTLTYASEDETVATVNASGFITAVAEGSTVVTVSSINGVQKKITVAVNAPVTYTVAFDTMGGTRVELVEVAADKIVTEEGEAYIGYLSLLPDTYKDGYSFCGWYTGKNGTGEMLGINTPIVDNVIYYAHWKSAQSENQEDDDYAGVLPEDIPEGGIPAGLWIAGIDEQGYPYTGQQVKPKVRVYDTDKRLKEGQDYTVSYKNNIRANDASGASKAPTITVKGKGNYGGKETATFKILPIDLNDTSVITEDIVTAYNKKVQKKVPALTYNGKKLAKNKDFTVSYPALEKGTNDAYKAVGTYDIVLTAKAGGNYTGTRTVKLTITDSILLSRVSVKKIPNQTYTGDAIEPEPTVTYKKTPLVKGIDYTVSYTNNTSAGTATAVLTGIGKYAGTKKITFKITGISLKKAEVSGIQDTIYDGTAQKQNIMVVAEHKILEEGTDYEVAYANNINAGKASITIKGKGGYTGTIKKTFRIEACYLLEEMGLQGEITAKYVKGGSRPKVELVFAGKKLKEGRDYTVSYQNNKAVTTAEVKKKPSITVRGKGNFKGTKIKYFTIINKALDDAELPVTMTVPDKMFSDKAGKYKSIPILTDADGKKLTVGKDYEKEIIYSLEDGTQLTNKSKAGVGTSIKVKVTGKGAYYGELESVYCITERDFTKTKISIVPQIYTGREITLDEEDITVKIGKDTLKFNTDYEIVETSYVGNIKKGTAKVTIRGKGSYGGMKTVKFRITAKNFAWFWRMFG